MLIGLVELLLLIFVGILLYFLPAIIASQRGHQNASGIFLLNALAGWTFIGWIASLVMACGEVRLSRESVSLHRYRRRR